jgi:hypothetical protein
MKEITCPICDATIYTADRKRENYAEIWFDLSDGSKMRVCVCSNCLARLDEKMTDDLFAKIQDGFNKELNQNPTSKKKHFDRVKNLKYKEVFDKGALSIKKNK